MAKNDQKYCMSTADMIIVIGIVLTILGGAVTFFDFYCYIIYYGKNRIPMSVVRQFFFLIALCMYFLATIYSSCLLCLDVLVASKTFDSFNFFTIAAVICAFIDGFLIMSVNSLGSLLFFVYFGVGALSLYVTMSAEGALKKEKQAILEQFNTGQIASTSGSSVEQQMLNTLDQDERPKFSMNLEAVKVEDGK